MHGPSHLKANVNITKREKHLEYSQLPLQDDEHNLVMGLIKEHSTAQLEKYNYKGRRRGGQIWRNSSETPALYIS